MNILLQISHSTAIPVRNLILLSMSLRWTAPLWQDPSVLILDNIFFDWIMLFQTESFSITNGNGKFVFKLRSTSVRW